MHGGFVCRAHGGAAARVRAAANERLHEISLRRSFDRAWSRWLRETAAWEAERRAIASELLGKPVAEVDAIDLALATVEHGPLAGPRPKLRDDRRFGTRRN